MVGSGLNSAHKRNLHQLTQPTNYNKQNSNQLASSHGPSSHYSNGAANTIIVQPSI